MQATSQNKGAAESQDEANLHRVAAMNHEAVTGADTVAHPQPDGSTKGDSLIAVENSQVPTSRTMANTVDQSNELAKNVPVKIGDTVRLRIVAAGVSSAVLASVTGVAALDPNRLGENGEPYLTVVYLGSRDRVVLGGAGWHDGFIRTGPIHHISSASAQAGMEGTVWTDVIGDPAGDVSLSALDMGEDAAKASYDAEVQRKIAGGAGYGPVDDADVNYQAATASDLASKGQLTGGGSSRDTTTTVQERINHPMGSVGSPRVPVAQTPGTAVTVGQKGSALMPTADESDANLGVNHALSSPSNSQTGTIQPGQETSAPSSADGKSAEEMARAKAGGLLGAASGRVGVVIDHAEGDGHVIVEDPQGNRSSTSDPAVASKA